MEANFTCGLCGAPLVVLELAPAPGDKIVARLICPNHRIITTLTLDHAALDLWVGVAADRVFRCARCGAELPPVPNASLHPDVAGAEVKYEGGREAFHSISFTLSCPRHGTQDNMRRVWDVLHRRLITEVQIRRGLEPPLKEAPPVSPSSAGAKLQVQGEIQQTTGSDERAEATADELSAKRIPLYCEQCGKRIRPGDTFCFHCGAKVTD